MNTRRFVRSLGGLTFVIACAASGGCKREERRFAETTVLSGDAPTTPGIQAPYMNNAWAISQGGQLFRWYNCAGCHSHGGGGMGPALMDDKWRYGSDPDTVFHTIVEGRPNGMPSFKDRLTEDQAWKLVAYVRSLSGLQSKASAPGRGDEMHNVPAPSRMGKPQPKPEPNP